jgi:predicted short-subunit dehydrogenase-like oxidoreductase (DUF2520 family)
MQIGILGPGRLGRTLAVLLARAGHAVRVFGRGETPSGEVILLTVPDDALATAAATVPHGPSVLHCSGASTLDVLGGRAHAGSLHPLMTFPGPEVAVPDLAGVPCAVAGDPVAVRIAVGLAADLGMVAFEVPGDRRLYHASAVIAGNFATTLFALACKTLTEAGVDAERAPALLLPLALQSLRNAVPDPVKALTGPIARGDERVVVAHRTALADANLGDVEAVYDTLAQATRGLVRVASTANDQG